MFSFLHDLRSYQELAAFIDEKDEAQWADSLFQKYSDAFNQVWFSKEKKYIYSSLKE